MISAALSRVSAWVADPHFCLYTYASVPGARGLVVAPNGDLFVATNGGQVRVLYDGDGNGLSDANETSTFATLPGLNHGVALTATHLYASADTAVYRWTYSSGQRTAAAAAEIVVHDIGSGGHVTRTLLVDGKQRLYVSIGSASNVDAPPAPDTPSPARAVIRRYDLTKLPAGGFAATDGELFAAGLRNEVAMAGDADDQVYGTIVDGVYARVHASSSVDVTG